MLLIKKLSKTDIDWKIQISLGHAYDFFHGKIVSDFYEDPDPAERAKIDEKIKDALAPEVDITIKVDGKPIPSKYQYRYDKLTLEFGDKFLRAHALQEGDLLVLYKIPWVPAYAKFAGDKEFQHFEELKTPVTEVEAYFIRKGDEENYKVYSEVLSKDKTPKAKKAFATIAASGIYKADGNVQNPVQKIYYGAPGTGKSHAVDEITSGEKTFRTTFHPDYDYASFVGTYKPVLEPAPSNDGQGSGDTKPPDERLTYKFVPQVFARAYVDAWTRYLDEPDTPTLTCLVIEEINRGNCAQIFGDIFQLLDRDDETGFSKYKIDVDEDFASYLKQEINTEKYKTAIKSLAGNDEPDFHNIWLPPNLCIYATMNTSDQSLFPMDSAFQRRWDWEYVPIEYGMVEGVKVEIGGELFSWKGFLETINKRIYAITESEDKQLGQCFVMPKKDKVEHKGENKDKIEGTIKFEVFRDKVFFYLWHEVFEDVEPEGDDNIFKTKDGPVSFSGLFTGDGKEAKGAWEIKYIMTEVLKLTSLKADADKKSDT